jgi:predicted GNAT family acetyltransferase
MDYTGVPPELQGQGLAALLVQTALDWARQEGLKVVAQCSYVAVYMRRHPETHDLREPP